MKMQNALKYFGYAMGALFVCTGISVLTLSIVPDYTPGQFRNMMGIVLILYGIYRIVVIFFKNREEDQ